MSLIPHTESAYNMLNPPWKSFEILVSCFQSVTSPSLHYPLGSPYCGYPRWCSSKEPACQSRNCRTHGLEPWVRKPKPGEGNGNPLPHSSLENPTDIGAWQDTVHGVTESQTGLSSHTQPLFYPLCNWLNIGCFQDRQTSLINLTNITDSVLYKLRSFFPNILWLMYLKADFMTFPHILKKYGN